MTQIKICGLTREADIDYVNEAKPDYIGFVLNFPKSRRNLTPERAAALKSRLSPDIKAVGVFVDRPEDEVVRAVETVGLDVIQLHGHENDAYIATLRERTALPYTAAPGFPGLHTYWKRAENTPDIHRPLRSVFRGRQSRPPAAP